MYCNIQAIITVTAMALLPNSLSKIHFTFLNKTCLSAKRREIRLVQLNQSFVGLVLYGCIDLTIHNGVMKCFSQATSILMYCSLPLLQASLAHQEEQPHLIRSSDFSASLIPRITFRQQTSSLVWLATEKKFHGDGRTLGSTWPYRTWASLQRLVFPLLQNLTCCYINWLVGKPRIQIKLLPVKINFCLRTETLSGRGGSRIKGEKKVLSSPNVR